MNAVMIDMIEWFFWLLYLKMNYFDDSNVTGAHGWIFSPRYFTLAVLITLKRYKIIVFISTAANSI